VVESEGSKEPRKKKRLGILGGTFNPIHLGHLRSAEETREALALSHTYFVPSFIPPHKEGKDPVAAHHRLHMVELAVADQPFFSPSAVELERGGKSFSIDTIRHFLTSFSPAALYFIMGLDAFREIHTWKDYPTIFSLCNVIVTSRLGCPQVPLTQLIPVALQGEFCYDPATAWRYTHTSGHILAFCPITRLDISSSAIRKRVQQGKSIRYLVPRQVEEYIAAHGLYQSGESDPVKEQDDGSQ
jgi:nicotinate-nucleotide adenylyltransferase